jgi:hypothetical protein
MTSNTKPPKPKAKAPPIIFISKEGIATFWFIVALIAIVGGAVYAERQATTKGLRPQYIFMENVAMNGKKLGAHMEPVVRAPQVFTGDPAAEEALADSQARLLLDSVFNKSSYGLDSPERCQRLMSEETWAWVKEHLVDPQSEAFDEGRLHQKIAVQSLQPTFDVTDETIAVEFSGQLIRTGILHGELFNQVWSVKGSILWERNPSLRDRGLFPLLCTVFACQETPVSTTQRRLTQAEEASVRARAAVESMSNNPQGGDTKPAKPAKP